MISKIHEFLLNLGRKIIPKWLFRLGQPVYHFLLALSGNILYRFPGRKLIVIGVTGTNGKSTTVELINSVLKEAGNKTGMLSTVAFEIAGKRTENTTSRTTLGRWQTPKLLREMVKAGCRYAALEVASEGIIQFRTFGIPFDVAVFTNLSPEHLNTHGTMVNYRNAKGKLFENVATSKKKKGALKISVVNADDREAKYFSSFPADLSVRYGKKNGEVRAKNIVKNGKLSFDVNYKNKNYFIQTDLIGTFNVYNILAAWTTAYALSVDPKKIKWGIEKIKGIKGRMEKVAEKNGVQYFIDYAMTPDAYELLLTEMRGIAKGRVIAVFGAAGDRDRGKRPKIGEVAAKNADYTILTEDEPYSEDPKEIVKEIETGFQKAGKSNYKVVLDRKKALKEAAKLAEPGDVVVVPGMGHEAYRNIGGNKKIPWNEAEIIRKIVG
ncbi:MAG: UDP-N-acetylmuramoyl-L-alanyl-D-glutamate--2,6-diaminopimelate ligase [Patescibacteria group bacterium]|nr:UDP-N-acetylmuramoyl-L-alanyl-D-glutamate--2,6-diaminopimelate ligase [Patescibacteria group bacterium]